MMILQSEDNFTAAMEVVINKQTNFSADIGNNLSTHSVNDLLDNKIALTGDKELFRTLYGIWEYDDYISDSLKVFFYWIYLIIFVIGVSGNVLVCYVFVCNKSMHTVTNLFITNLALSDILLCVFAVPFTPLYMLTFKEWVFGSTLCHLVPYIQGVSVYISSFTLMSIAIDRFFVIIYPFKPRMKLVVCAFIIVVVWFAAAIFTLPYGYFVRTIENPYDKQKYLCDEGWPSEATRRAFGITTSLVQFVVPVIIISFCYIKVCGKLSDKSRTIIKSARKEELERERTSRTNRMLISMVIIFGISWLPLNCYNLVLDFHIQAARWNYSRALFLLAHSIAMSSTCYNPLLYAWLNENFRKEFKSVLPCWRTAGSGVTGSSRRDQSSNPITVKLNDTSQRILEKDLKTDNINGDDNNDNIDSNDNDNRINVTSDKCDSAQRMETTVEYMPKSDCVVLHLTKRDHHNNQVIL